MSALQTEHLDVESLVQERFEPYFGEAAGQPLAEQVIADSGLDSIGLVMVLTDLFREADLDVGDSHVRLRDLRTLEDVAAIIKALMNGEPTGSMFCEPKG